MSFFSEKRSPKGIFTAINSLNKFPQQLLAKLCQDVVDALQYKGSVPQVSHYQSQLEKNSIDLGKNEVQSTINVLFFLYRDASKISNLDQKQFLEILQNQTGITNQAGKVLATIWEREKENLPSLTMPNVGKLIDFKWKVGVTFSSSISENLVTPFVTVNISVSNTDELVQTHSFEMSVPEFKEFARNLKEINQLLEVI
ncbi:comm domain-containing protein [Anaeramoeba flamelloides]|uniref:COMM domain-containing protein 6 n=1 Tax=Anaeramoeba flamelloides TaxID=1746091 RepID=A0AAV7Z026_9EUKA|nr:comm domain-containing protein [Anaeramoeba flamelloides]